MTRDVGCAIGDPAGDDGADKVVRLHKTGEGTAVVRMGHLSDEHGRGDVDEALAHAGDIAAAEEHATVDGGCLDACSNDDENAA